MIRGVRKPEEARALGLSRRLMVRLGALLKKSVEVTPALLEVAKTGPSYEALLLDPRLLEQAQELDAKLLHALSSAHLKFDASAGVGVALAPGADGARVLCLDEELEASEGWDAPGAEAPAGAMPLAQSGGALAGASAARTAGPEGAEAGFSRGEWDRLRLKLVAASDPAERIEALRLLAHAPLSSHEKAEALFKALEDPDAKVRGEAAGLLFVIGVPDDVGESLQALGHPRKEARLRAAERLIKRLDPGAQGVEVGAVAAFALAAWKAEEDGAVLASLLALLGRCASELAQSPPRLAELVRAIVRRVSAAEAEGGGLQAQTSLRSPALRLFQRIRQAAPEVLVPLLWEEREQSADAAGVAFLLESLLGLHPPGDPREPELLRLCASYLARDTQEGRDSRTLGANLVSRGEPALAPLVEAFPRATTGAQKYILRLLDDLVRFQKIAAAAKEPAGKCLLQALETGSRGVRMVAMHCRMATDPDLPEDLRAKLARCCLASCGDFGFKTDIEIVEEGVARIGLPAIAPLLERLPQERQAEGRVQAVRILGQMALTLKAPRGEMRRTAEAITEVLRRLQALRAEEAFPDRAVLHAAMGKLATSPAASRQAAEVVGRNLLQACQTEGKLSGIGALEGLAWLASSHRADPALIATVSGLLRNAMEQAHTDFVSETREVEGEKVIEISQGEDLVEMIPVALSGISRIARSGSCPPAHARELVKLLLARWRAIVSGATVWGPANAMLAVRSLQDLGAHPPLPDDLRLQILKALAPRLYQPPVLLALGVILAASDTQPSCAVALTLGVAIAARRRPDGRFDPEDRPDLLRTLGRIAARRHLGAPDAQGREKARQFRAQVSEDLFQGAKDLVSGAYEELIRLREARVLPEEDQAALERRLAEFHSLALS